MVSGVAGEALFGRVVLHSPAARVIEHVAGDFHTRVAVETTEPYDVAAIRLTDFDRQVGSWEVRRLLESYKSCLSSGVWPGACIAAAVPPSLSVQMPTTGAETSQVRMRSARR